MRIILTFLAINKEKKQQMEILKRIVFLIF